MQADLFVRAIADALPLAAFVFDRSGQVTHANSAAARIAWSADGANDVSDVWALVERACESGEVPATFAARLLFVDRQSADAMLAAFPFRDPSGRLTGALVFVKDLLRERAGKGEVGASGAQADSKRETGPERLVAYVGDLLGADYVYVAEVEPDVSATASVLAAWDGGPVLPYEFAFGGTPVVGFAGRRMVRIPSGLREAFPTDAWIAEQRFEAFVGVALTDESGGRLGALIAMWKQPLTETSDISAVMRIVGDRATEIVAERRAWRELAESEERYSAMFEDSHLPMMIIDPESSQIIDANPAAERFYGEVRDDLRAMSIFQVDDMPADHVRAELLGALRRTRGHFSSKHRSAGGMLRDVEISAGPIVLRGREVLFALVNDVTDRRKAEVELERYKGDLERLVQDRTRDLVRTNTELQRVGMTRDMLFATLSHELRTSLQTIVGFTEVMRGGLAGALTEEQERQLAMVHEAGTHLAEVFSGIVESHSAEAGATSTTGSREAVDLAEMLESSVFGLRSFAEDGGHGLTLDVQAGPLMVSADRYRLQHAIFSLISTALGDSAAGDVHVTALTDAGYTLVRVSSAPVPAAGSGDSRFDAGLGMTATRRLAESLGATLEVEQSATDRVVELRLAELGGRANED